MIASAERKLSRGSLGFCLGICLILTHCSGCDAPTPTAQPSGEGAKIRVAFVTNGIAPFWNIAKAGAEAAAAELDVECLVRMPKSNQVADQKEILEDLLTSGIDGIAVSPIDPKNQVEQIDSACEKTLVITQDSDAPGTKRLAFIGVDNYQAGRLCGQLVKEALPDGGSLMIFVGRLSQDNARLRRQGVIDELMERSEDSTRYDPPGEVVKNERYTVLGTKTDQFDFSKAKANAEDTLTRYPDIGCMVGLFTYNPPKCLEALKQAGKLGQVKVVAFDEDDDTLAAIEAGHVTGTIVQNPYRYGHESVKVLKALVDGDRSVIPADGFIHVPARRIDRTNVREFWADLKAKMGS